MVPKVADAGWPVVEFDVTGGRKNHAWHLPAMFEESKTRQQNRFAATGWCSQP